MLLNERKKQFTREKDKVTLSTANPLQKVSLFYFYIFFLDEKSLSFTKAHSLEPHSYKSTHDSLCNCWPLEGLELERQNKVVLILCVSQQSRGDARNAGHGISLPAVMPGTQETCLAINDQTSHTSQRL